MKRSRRHVLGIGVVSLVVGTAGCIYHGPFPRTRLTVTVREAFDPDPPVTVPLSVEAFVQNVDSDTVALRGVELELYDPERERLETDALGDFDWRDADPDQREREEVDTGWGSSATSYSADWTVEHDVEVDAVPDWVTFRVDQVWFGDDETGERERPATDGESAGRSFGVGTARATSPPPEFSAEIRHFAGDRPPTSPVRPDDYEPLRQTSRAPGRGVGVDEPLLPTPSAETDEVESIEFDVERETIAVGERTDVSVTATFADGTRRDVTRSATIVVGDNETAWYTRGELLGRVEGEVIVEARYGSRSERTLLTVTEPESTDDDATGNQSGP